MLIESLYEENRKFFKSLSHILYLDCEQFTTSIDPYSNQTNSIQSLKLFNLIYKTIDLNNFFFSIFYLLVPSYIDFTNKLLIDEFYDQALKDYDQFDLFKQFNYRHKYNKQMIRNFLKEKVFNSIVLQFIADYCDINIIIVENNKLNIIYSKIPTPYKVHIILLKQNNEFQPIFEEKKYMFTSMDQISWIAFRKHIMISSFEKK